MRSAMRRHPAPQRRKLFVSYSHKDREWLDRLHVHLKPLERQGLDLWDDTRIQPGMDWRREVCIALDAAQVVVLLLSADFLASDYLVDEQLPVLLTAAEREGVAIMPVLVKPCRYRQFQSLERFCPVNAPERALILLSEGEQEEVFARLATQIDEIFTTPSYLPRSTEPDRGSQGGHHILRVSQERTQTLWSYFV